MEWWILLGIAIVTAAAAILHRMRGRKRRPTHEDAENIYPLW